MLVMEFGVREAARRMNLNEDTVSTWSARGKWLAKFREKPILPLSMQPKQITGIVPTLGKTIESNESKTIILPPKTPAQVLEESLLNDSSSTKSAASRLVRRAMEAAGHVEVNTAQDALTMIKAASILHGWEGKAGDSGHPLNVISQINIEIN